MWFYFQNFMEFIIICSVPLCPLFGNMFIKLLVDQILCFSKQILAKSPCCLIMKIRWLTIALGRDSFWTIGAAGTSPGRRKCRLTNKAASAIFVFSEFTVHQTMPWLTCHPCVLSDSTAGAMLVDGLSGGVAGESVGSGGSLGPHPVCGYSHHTQRLSHLLSHNHYSGQPTLFFAFLLFFLTSFFNLCLKLYRKNTF